MLRPCNTPQSQPKCRVVPCSTCKSYLTSYDAIEFSLRSQAAWERHQCEIVVFCCIKASALCIISALNLCVMPKYHTSGYLPSLTVR
mmetsp:Transcript_4848/g.11571  ORF Transcript_4848/g.11571 Transcript_4848/m.11571 type:complete len:87 (+) Transcript_4848:59-319(+)